jgi:hypothetical protein
MTKDQKLNALTRLTIIVTAVLYWMKYEYWLTFFLITIFGIIMLKYATCKVEKEGFSFPPTYRGIDHQETVLAPTFAEEWQIPPVTYDLVDEVYDDDDYGPHNAYGRDESQRYVQLQDLGRYKDPLSADPYGQYLTKTNQLPGDEEYERKQGSLSAARAYANDAFVRHRDAFQEDMTRIHKKRIARRYSQNLYTVSSAFTSRP